jgi:hypothetical protein
MDSAGQQQKERNDVVPACIQSKCSVLHIPQPFPALLIRRTTPRSRITSSSSCMLTRTRSVTPTLKSKMDLSAVVRPRLAALGPYLPLQPHRHRTLSSRSSHRKMYHHTGIPLPRQDPVARRSSHSACQMDPPPHRHRIRKSTLRVIKAIRLIPRPPQRRPRCTRRGRQQRVLLARYFSDRTARVNRLSACSTRHYRTYRVSRERTLIHLVFRTKLVNRSWWEFGQLLRHSIR